MPQPKDGKNQLDSQAQKFMLNLLKKKLINKIKYSRSSPDLDFFVVTTTGHIIYFRSLSILRHLWGTQKSQNRLIQSRRISCNWGENFRLFQQERFLEPILSEKVLILLLITCELVSATM